MVSISSPSSEGGGLAQLSCVSTQKKIYVSISSPSSEGGGVFLSVVNFILSRSFPLVLLQAKVVGFFLCRSYEDTGHAVSISSPSSEGGG